LSLVTASTPRVGFKGAEFFEDFAHPGEAFIVHPSQTVIGCAGARLCEQLLSVTPAAMDQVKSSAASELLRVADPRSFFKDSNASFESSARTLFLASSRLPVGATADTLSALLPPPASAGKQSDRCQNLNRKFIYVPIHSGRFRQCRLISIIIRQLT